MRALGRVDGWREEFYLRWRLGGHLIDHWLKKINKLLISWTDEVGWEFRTYAEVRAYLQVQSQHTTTSSLGPDYSVSWIDGTGWEIRAYAEVHTDCG